MPFGLGKPDLSPDEKLRRQIVDSIKSYTGDKGYIPSPQPHQRLPGSSEPENLFDVYVAKSAGKYEAGDYGVMTVGFMNNQPYVYGSETYSTTTPGVLPVNVLPDAPLLYNVGANNENVMSPGEHIGALAAMALYGNPGGSKQQKTRTMQEKLATALNIGGTLDIRGRNVHLPGLPVAITPNMSSAELQSLTIGPQLAPQSRKGIFGEEESAYDRLMQKANANGVAGLYSDVYTVQDFRGGPQRLVPSRAFGFVSPLGKTEAFTANPLKSPVSDRRESAPLIEVFKGHARPLESSLYYTNSGVMNRGDVPQPQLHLNAIVPLTELPNQSGMGFVNMPYELRQQLEGRKSHVEAGYYSQKGIDIMGVNRPQDLYYTDAEGNQRLRLSIRNQFLPGNIQNRNTIPAGTTKAIADFAGREGDQIRRKRLDITTGERPFSVINTSLTIPEKWISDESSRRFVEETLAPELQQMGVGLNYAASKRDDFGYTLKLSAVGYQHEGAAFKGGISSKITGSPMETTAVGLWEPGSTGNLALKSQADAIIPVKNINALMWGIVRGLDPNKQKDLLIQSMKNEPGDKRKITEYFNNLNGGDLVLSDLASELGMGPIDLVTRMTKGIVGSTPIISGNRKVNQRELAQQEENYQKFGIGRSVGFIPFDIFTSETKKQYIAQAASVLQKEGLTKAQAMKRINATMRFEQGKTLEGGLETFVGYQYGEVIRSKDTPVNAVIEWSGVSRDTLNSTVDAMMLQGNTKLAEFLNARPQEFSTTQRALRSTMAARSDTLQGEGQIGKYIRVSDETASVDPATRTINPKYLNTLIGQYSTTNASPAEVLEKVNQSLSNSFGSDKFGLEIVGPKGKGSAFIPALSSVKTLDELGEALDVNAENELQLTSVGRYSERTLSTLSNMLSGNPADYEQGRNQLLKQYSQYLKSPNIEKTEVGIYGAFSGTGLLKPGEIFLTQNELQRYYRIAGGDINNKAEFGKYMNLFKGGVFGVAERQPKPNVGVEGLPGSVFQFSVLTAMNDPRGAYIQKLLDQSGIRTQGIVTSTSERATFGDLDADKFGITLALARNLGGDNASGVWSKFTGGATNASELNANIQKVLASRSPEQQQKAFDTVFEGMKGGSLEFDPFSKNIRDYFGALFGNENAETLLRKKSLTALLDMGPEWQKANENANFQKKVAMGSTYNQLLRRPKSAGMALGYEPATTQRIIDKLGTKSYQSAIDQKYDPQQLVSMLQGAFISPQGQSLAIKYNQTAKGDPKFTRGNLPLSQTNDMNDVMVGMAANLMYSGDNLTAYNYATLFGQMPKELIGAQGLSARQSNDLVKKQSAFFDTLTTKFQSILDAPADKRGALLRELKESGELGAESIAGYALGSRLYEHYSGKIKSSMGSSASSQKSAEQVEKIKSIASNMGINIDEMLDKYSPASNLFEIFKGDENSPDLGSWKDPVNFASMATSWMERGIHNDPTVQQIMKIYGEPHGLSYGTDKSGKPILRSSSTKRIIRNQEDLNQYRETIQRKTGRKIKDSSTPVTPVVPPEMVPDVPVVQQSSIVQQAVTGGQTADSSYRNQWMEQASPEIQAYRSMRFAKQWYSAEEKGSLEPLVNLGATYLSSLQNVTGQDQETLMGASPLEAYEYVRSTRGKEVADAIIRNNPNASRALGTLSAMKRGAKGAVPNLPIGSNASAFALIASGQSPEMKEVWSKDEFKAGILSTLPLTELGIGKGIAKAPFTDASAMALSGINMSQTALHNSQLAYTANPTARNKQIVNLQEREFHEQNASFLMGNLSFQESAMGVPGQYRISNIDRSKMSTSEYLREIDTRKSMMLNPEINPNASDYAKGIHDPYIEPYKKSVEAGDKSFGEATSGKMAYDIYKEKRENIDVATFSKVNSVLREFAERVDTTSKAYKEQEKAIKDGTSIREIEKQGIKQKMLMQEDTARAWLGGSGTGRLSDQERMKLQGLGRNDFLAEYGKTQAELTGLETEEEKQRGSMSKIGSAARHIFGGFGLMYMRSIAGIIGSSGEFGYNESTAMEQGVTGALAGQWGPNAGYNAEANISGAKALYGGGGRRYINQVYENLLRNSPGLVNAGNSLVSGLGAFGATAWAGGELTSALGIAGGAVAPIAAGVGMLVGVGSAVVNQIGRASDETTWVAANYKGVARNSYGNLTPAMGWNDLIAKVMFSASDATGIGTGTDFYKNMDENYRLSVIAKQAEDLVTSGKAKTRQEALQQLGVVESDRFRLEKIYAYEFTTSNMPGISEQGRIGAVQAWESMGGTVDTAKYGTLQKLGQSYDAGIDVAGLAQTLATAGGFQFSSDRTTLLSGLSSTKLNVPQIGQLQTVASFAQQMGVGWTKKNFGMNIEDFTKSMTGGLEPKTVTTSRTAGTPDEIQKLAEDVVRKQYTVEQLDQEEAGWGNPALGIEIRKISAWDEYNDAKKLLENALKQVTTTEQIPNELPQNVQKIAGALTGSNATAAQAWFSYQKQMQSAGVNIGLESMPQGFLNENLTPEQRLTQENKWLYAENTASQISKYGVQTNRNVGGISRYWNSLVESGTQKQQTQFADLISNPNPLNIGAYVSKLGPGGAQQFWGTYVDTIGGGVSAGMSAFTGVDQRTGNVTGGAWGVRSLALPGYKPGAGAGSFNSPQAVASQIWGQNWQSNNGMAQGAVNAMVNGFQLGDQTVYGQQALSAWQNQQSYNVASAQAGVQMRQIALSSTFTTGVGLGSYSGTINPQTGKSFGINTQGGGFWGIEDRQRALSYAQQEYSFQSQQQQMDMSNKFYQQDTAMQRKQMTMQRQYAQQDWSMQENVRDLQWGWKQEDYQENIRFMTGRERRLAERQMKRDTTMHDIEGDQIDVQKKRQQEMWKLEDQRFAIAKQQHNETLNFQKEQLTKAKEFFKQSKALEDESVKLQRAYFVEQQKLQKESAGISASAAKVQKDLNDAMLKYSIYSQKADDQQVLLNSSLSNMVTLLQTLVTTLGGVLPKLNEVNKMYTNGFVLPGNISNSVQSFVLTLDGRVIANAVSDVVIRDMR